MYFRLSNNFIIEDVEKVYGLDFKFPSIYEKQLVIDGLRESILPIISNENVNTIDYGIWGILPQNFTEGWRMFQNVRNTLNLNIDDVIEGGQFGFERRCCILVSGFFASFFYQGEVYPIYVHSAKDNCFALAGIYSITHDGFKTFTLLLKKSNTDMRGVHNVSNHMPIVFNQDGVSQWLSEDYTDIIRDNYDNFSELNINSHPIAKEFFKNDIYYKSILEPVNYKKLTIKSLQ